MIDINFERTYKGIDVYSSQNCEAIMAVVNFKREEKGERERAILYNSNICSNFSTDELIAMFEHEIGHITLNHAIGTWSLENEINADLYSAKVVGIDIVIQTLKKAKYEMERFKDLSRIGELNYRIEAMINYNSN